jgi:hypothetical protein
MSSFKRDVVMAPCNGQLEICVENLPLVFVNQNLPHLYHCHTRQSSFGFWVYVIASPDLPTTSVSLHLFLPAAFRFILTNKQAHTIKKKSDKL